MKANQFSCHFEKLETFGLEGLRVAIIGGGIAGLAAAWELRRQLGPNTRILLTEAYDRLGGKLKTVNYANGPVDMGAEAYMGFRQDFTELVESVGLGNQLCVPSGLPSGFYVDGALVDIPRRTLMGIPSRGADVAEVVGQDGAARIDAERNGQPMTWTPGQDTSVGQLVEARLGRIVVDRLVSPLLGGVYSCNAFDLGVRATLPQLAAELDRRGALGQPFFLVDAIERLLSQRPAPKEGEKPKPVFRSLRGGYASLVDALVRNADPELLRNTAVESIGRTRGGYYIDPIGEFDAVIVATPAPTASAILQYMAPTAADVLGDIDLASSVVVGMRMASAHGIPERSGVLLGSDAPTEAKAFTFSSRKWPHLGERGGAFVRASFGSFGNPWHLDVDNRALLSFAVEDLERITGERKTPEEYFVQRWWGGLPRYGVGYMDAMSQAYDEVLGIRGLALAGSMLNGVGVPATAASGVEAAREIIREMA
ncbi:MULTISPECIES: protoporphyrinogen oxidase [unclassified Corynebacterium]|uniref:protoporphyrinogen oxidase n=1 Tax=unclassified Corynebacterium TaxID=2624378 RepID=UPI001EF713E0|nr:MULTISPECIES: protoporphyrinogen oxidase [unclassified Corynebacterium]MCG7257925.1 protoporphyrinogen oxidase [Corynebacterium sp. ACRQK]MCG7262358.1 protoporphyrinogen oxidase [Corynebacterium sp. ACRQL]